MTSLHYFLQKTVWPTTTRKTKTPGKSALKTRYPASSCQGCCYWLCFALRWQAILWQGPLGKSLAETRDMESYCLRLSFPPLTSCVTLVNCSSQASVSPKCEWGWNNSDPRALCILKKFTFRKSMEQWLARKKHSTDTNYDYYL